MWKIFDLSESATVDFQITGRGKVTMEIHSFRCMYENFNKLLDEIYPDGIASGGRYAEPQMSHLDSEKG